MDRRRGSRETIPVPTGNYRGGFVAVRLLYVNAAGKWAWQLTADNGAVIATDGSQGYENEDDARTMVNRIISGEFKDAKKRIRRPDE